VLIALKRAYEKPSSNDGYRVLVDRIWPRGVSKDAAQLDEWIRDAAPTKQLRKWFHGNRSRWGEFRRRYLAELKQHRETLRPLARRARRQRVTLVFAASDEHHNNSVVLQQYLKMLHSGAKDSHE
jgi:uncharacterized protein YeaO (DUF488 family)